MIIGKSLLREYFMKKSEFQDYLQNRLVYLDGADGKFDKVGQVRA